MSSNVIEKTGLILDRLIMESPELSAYGQDPVPESETDIKQINIKTNEDFHKNLKNINLLLYLKYPSVIDLSRWGLEAENDSIVLTTETIDLHLQSLSVFIGSKPNGNSNSSNKNTESKVKNNSLTMTDKFLILYGIAKAICHFQSKFVVHGQLDLNNICIAENEKFKYPKIQNFENSTVFYDPSKIELNMFLSDVQSFQKILIEIFIGSEIDESDNMDLCKELDSLVIDGRIKDIAKKTIESNKDPVAIIREFIKDIEGLIKHIEESNGGIEGLKEIDTKVFNDYMQSFTTIKEQKSDDGSDIFDIIQKYCGNDSNKNLLQMIEELIDKSRHGNCNADFNLGICYLKGIGIPQNFGIGYHYISRAEKENSAARALKIILEQRAFVLKSRQTSTTLYQQGQIFECQMKYKKAYNCYIQSIKKACTGNKHYNPSFGRVGCFLLNQAKGNIEIEMKGIDFLKIGYDNEDPYATFELYIYFKSKGSKDVPLEIAEKVGVTNRNELEINAPKIASHFYKKAASLGLPVEKMQT